MYLSTALTTSTGTGTGPVAGAGMVTRLSAASWGNDARRGKFEGISIGGVGRVAAGASCGDAHQAIAAKMTADNRSTRTECERPSRRRGQCRLRIDLPRSRHRTPPCKPKSDQQHRFAGPTGPTARNPRPASGYNNFALLIEVVMWRLLSGQQWLATWDISPAGVFACPTTATR